MTPTPPHSDVPAIDILSGAHTFAQIHTSVQSQPGGSLPAAIIFGGIANALSLVRSLGRRGVTTYVLNTPASHVPYSRYARRIKLPQQMDFTCAATAFLTGAESDPFAGSVLLAANDNALEMIAKNRDILNRKFLLDLSSVSAQLRMLDKLTTYQAAQEAGVPTPLFWNCNSRQTLEAVRGELVFPLLIKPKLSHVFQRHFDAKFLLAHDLEQARLAMGVAERAGVDVMLVEFIPGGDDQLCSYYTYMDETGAPCFDFTKRIIRRHPKNMGPACYHITDKVPRVRELSLRLFRHVGLQGLGNAEFKWDSRDGTLKLIECNARFTAANCLVDRAGYDLGWFVYCRLVGIPLPTLPTYRTGLRLWNPRLDFAAFRELHSAGELTLFAWLASITHWQTFPTFSWRDPLPSMARFAQGFSKRLARFSKTSTQC